LLFTFPYDHTSSPAPGIRFIRQFLKRIANLPWVARKLFNPQSWTHAAVARGQSGNVHLAPAEVHGCRPLL